MLYQAQGRVHTEGVALRILFLLPLFVYRLVRGQDTIGQAGKLISIAVIAALGFSLWDSPSIFYIVGSDTPISWGIIAGGFLGLLYSGYILGLTFVESGFAKLKILGLEFDPINKMLRLSVYNKGPVKAIPVGKVISAVGALPP